MRRALFTLLSATLLIGLAGCDDDASDPGPDPSPEAEPAPEPDPSPEGEPSGELLFMNRHDDGNTFACNTCHALTEPTADFRRPGHPLGDAAMRPSFKNGQVDTLLEAVNSCRTEWMVAPPFGANDDRWQALQGFLATAAGDAPADPLVFEIVQPPADLEGGDVEAGRDAFNGTCAVCHGAEATGTQLAPPLNGEFLTADLIARRVRTSGVVDSPVYDGLTGGRMPFWSADRLSDAELTDIIAFVVQNDPGDIVPEPDPEPEMVNPGDCASTHALVGSEATFETFAHQVGGTATVVDDCTIRIDDFTFDGQGVNVQLYGGLAGAYAQGFSMSGDLRRSPGYAGESLTFTLPEGTTLDDLDGVSIWCVPVGINFGDARFE